MPGLSIAHVTNSFRSDGTGITNIVADLATAQADRGHRVVVVCDGADERMRELTALHGITLVEDAGTRSLLELLRSAWGLGPLLSSADVIHVHTVRAALLGLTSTPIRFLRSSVATVHNPYQWTTIAMLTTRTVVALSEVDARAVHRRSAGTRRARVITNGVLGSARTSPLDSVQPVPLPSNALVFVGALTRRKGLDVLLRAMVRVLEEVPSARLFIVGNRDAAEMERLGHDLGLDAAVSFVGFSDDPRRYLAAATAFVLPSRAEGFPLALIEARGCGTAIVATRVGGIPQAVDGGTAALLVEPDDVAALTSSLIAVLSDQAVQDRLRTASSRGLARFTVDRMAADYTRIYDAIAPSEHH